MGGTLSILGQMFPSKPKFSVDQIPDLTGKITIVTGGYTGIGKETVKVLLQHNAKVYIAGRSSSKRRRPIADLKKITGKDALFLKLDLADLKAIKAAAEEFLSKEETLHVLFNSGGVMAPPHDQLTADGYDLQFGTNVLGHFYFTKLLVPALIAGAKSSPDRHSRVLTTSSSMMYAVSDLKFASFRDGPARKKITTEDLYSYSKFGNVVFANELAKRYGNDGIISISLNPGNIKTELQRHMGTIQHYLVDLILYPVEYGALSQLWGATMPEALEAQGKFLVPWARIGKAKKQTDDPELGKALWDWLEEQVANV